MNQSIQSLPAFLNQNEGLPAYGVICLAARTHGVPGISKSPSGYGWIVTDPKLVKSALLNPKTSAIKKR
jgi:hypothetical protein